jgi:acyl carrier protein
VNRQQALDHIRQALTRIAPDADFATIGAHDKLRDVLELDSLDYLRFIEALTTATGVPITEEDYTHFTTLADGTEFLVARSMR